MITAKLDGYLLKLVTDPGVVAPQDNYDVVIEDGEGQDVLLTQGTNRDTANTEVVTLVAGTYFRPVVSQADTLTLKISGNNVNSATTVISLYWSPASG